MRRFAFALTALLLTATACFGGTVLLEPGTPIFSEPKLPPQVIAVATAPTELEEVGTKLVLVQVHPLARYYKFIEVRLPDGRTGFYHPEIVMTPEGNLEFGSMVNWYRAILPALFGGILAALCAILWKRRNEEDPWRWLQIGLIPVFLRMFLLVLLVNGARNIIGSPADETGYHGNLISFLNGDFSGRWHFTVGTSIFYLPFELASGTRMLADIMVPVSWVEGFLLAPLSLFLGYLIGRKLLKSDLKAGAAMLLWAILPFIWHHQPDFPNRWVYAMFSTPTTEFLYPHYITLIGCGFSAMSDVPSTMLMLLVMVVLLYRKASWHTAALAAFLFGLACLFRINNIVFLPALAAICWLWRPEYFAGIRRTGLHAAAGAGAFLLGFLPQMLANWKFFGHPLKFSYTNYAEGAHTYLHWMFVELNSAFYGMVNQIVWIPAILSLFFLKDRKLRVTLVLWAIPVIWFFFGYSHGCDDPIRFILTSYPAFMIAIAGNGLWKKMKGGDFAWGGLLLLGLILCVPNPSRGLYSYYWEAPLNFVWRSLEFKSVYALGVAAMAIAVVMLFRRDRKLGAFLGIGCAVYVLGNAYWLVLGLAAVFLYAMWDCAVLAGRSVKLLRLSRRRDGGKRIE